MMSVTVSTDGSNFNAEPPVTLFQTATLPIEIGSWGSAPQYDVTSDGSKFLINTIVTPPTPPSLYVIADDTCKGIDTAWNCAGFLFRLAHFPDHTASSRSGVLVAIAFHKTGYNPRRRQQQSCLVCYKRQLSAESETRAAVEATTTAFHQALRTDNADEMFRYVAEDVVMMPPGESEVRGKAAVRAWYEGFSDSSAPLL
jgi:hypothetical protein